MNSSEFIHNPSDSDSGHNGGIDNGSNSGERDVDESPTLDTVSGFSSCSSPIPSEPFQPRFTVRLTDDVVKDGNVVKYTIKSINKDATKSEHAVQRQYEDFEWLEHCLLTSNSIFGVIVPPLPAKPSITSEMAEAKSKRQLGSNTRTLMGDDFFKDCRQLEQYLGLLLCHPLFGNEIILEKFLTQKEPPARVKIKKGFLSRLSDSLESRKDMHRDCEEFFQKERDWAKEYGHWTKESNQAFDGMIFSQQRLCGVMGHLATALSLCVGGNEENSQATLRECSVLSESLEICKHGLEVESFNCDRYIGSYLDLYSKFIDSEKEMLAGRTSLLVEYENSNRTMDLAKPNKREAAEEAKLAAEKAFEECSDVARLEIKRFHRQRVHTFGKALEKYADAQVCNAREVHALLTKSLNQLEPLKSKNLKILPD